MPLDSYISALATVLAIVGYLEIRLKCYVNKDKYKADHQ